MRLPPLNALRAFEAAARNLSFTRAAAELHVTQAAVSHQIKGLEDWLGIPLFRRLNRGLLLTEEGLQYLGCVRTAFEELNAGTQRLLAGDRQGVLTVSVIPSFAARWLVPRLGRFRDAHPYIDVRLAATLQNVDFARDDVDLGIRYGAGRYPDLHATYIMQELYFPVCAPALLDGRLPLERPDDLRHHTLLHDEYGPGETNPQWKHWLRAAGATGVRWDRGPVFGDASMMIQAAIGGQGVALGRETLVVDDLAAGRLARPFALSLPANYAYWMVCPRPAADRPKIVAFRDWLMREAVG